MATLRATAEVKNSPDAIVTNGGHSTAASSVITMDTVEAATASCWKTRPRRLMPWELREVEGWLGLELGV
jgi:hypothetical protein